jgi:hypothetical protein
VGSGSFVLHLPAPNGRHGARTTGTTPETEPGGPNGETILVMED